MAEPLKCINLRICAFQTHNLLINHLLRRCQNASQLYINHDKIKKSSIFVSMTLKINLRISPAYTFKLRRYLHNFFTMRTNVLCESRRTANENREEKKYCVQKMRNVKVLLRFYIIIWPHSDLRNAKVQKKL